MLGALEEKNNANAANPHDVIDQWNINLALCGGWVVDLDVRHKIKLNCLRDNGVRTCNQSLGGNNCSQCRKNNGKRPNLIWKHLKEGVKVFDGVEALVGVVGNEPRSLAKVVQDEAYLNKWPTSINIVFTNMTHVRIKSFCTGSTKEDAAQDHKSCSI